MTMLEKTLKWIVWGGIFILPFVSLIVANSMFFPYITGKNFTFRIIVEITMAAWLALMLVNAAYRPRRSWILGVFALFTLIVLIADLQGVNVFKSLWSNYERMEGWVTIAHLLAYLFVAASMMTERLWRWLFWENLGISVFLALMGLMQVAGVVALGQAGQSGLSARVDATFGNPIYLAGYMLFQIFIASLLWLRSWNVRSRGERLAPSLLYGAIIALDTLALFLTGTRGTMLGLIGGAMLAVIIYALFAGGRRVRVAAVGSIIAVILLAAGLHAARETDFVRSVGFLERLASISITDRTIAARFLNMGVAWQGVKERPIFGWGQENYAIVFDKYYDPRMYADEPWFDRVHNSIFDWLIAAGTLGLLSYLAIFAAALWALWMRVDAFSMGERAILTGLLAGYFAHNLTVFDNITSYILFVTILAYIVHRSAEANDARPILTVGTLSTSMLPYATLAIALGLWGVAWTVNAAALQQNRALIQAISPRGDASQNLELFRKAIAYQSLGTQEVREQLIQATTQMAQATTISDQLKRQFFELSASEMQQQAAASPLDARFPLFLGSMLQTYGDYASANTALQKAHELSPRKQSIYYLLGQNAFARGDAAAGLADFKTAYELEMSNKDARLYYAAALIRASRTAEAMALLEPLIATGEAADQRILAALGSRGEFTRAIPLWRARIEAKPDDMQAYATLAAIYYQAGDRARSIETLQAAEAVNPAVKVQFDPLIEQIRSGTVQIQ